ncbi:MAG: substrate-binding domain-containing protein, partial [Planctomycetia bacterium]|nr:substrate-binding domain-containing protein [Planctomycetia bacterium]
MSRLPLNIPRISVLLPVDHESTRGLLRGILQYEKLHGPWNIHLEAESPSFVLFQKDSHPVPDGVIVWPNKESFRKRLFPFLGKGIPTILVDPWEEVREMPEFQGASKLVCDSVRLGEMAADYFLQRGFEQFAFVGEYSQVIWSRRRLEGFTQRLAENEKTCQVYQPPVFKKYDFRKEERYLARWLLSLPHQCALLAAMDLRGIQVIETCAEVGLEVPHDLSVLSIDNDDILCQIPNPAMSSIQMDLENAGFLAAEHLDALIHGRAKPGTTLFYGASRIVSRASTASILSDDPIVVQAVEFIRVHASRAIGVPDVLRYLDISRRKLERHFAAALGHSVLEEILQRRLERLCQLLADTNLPHRELAELCGFANESYMGKV